MSRYNGSRMLSRLREVVPLDDLERCQSEKLPHYHHNLTPYSSTLYVPSYPKAVPSGFLPTYLQAPYLRTLRLPLYIRSGSLPAYSQAPHLRTPRATVLLSFLAVFTPRVYMVPPTSVMLVCSIEAVGMLVCAPVSLLGGGSWNV